MNNVKHSRAVKFGTIFCVTLLSALITFTTRLTARRNMFVYMAFGLLAFVVLGGAIGIDIFPPCVPNDAKDIFATGI